MNTLNIMDFGARGNGVADDAPAIQQAFDKCGHIYIPAGEYRLGQTLKIHSDTVVTAEQSARLFRCETVPKKRGDFLITNADHIHGNENITISGGVWCGNVGKGFNKKADNMFDTTASSGATLNFLNVHALTLTDLEIADSIGYYMRMCEVDGFQITHLRLSAKRLSPNQDGLHFVGGCRNGIVSDIRATTRGTTNDDLLAINADDSFIRHENLDTHAGTIENIVFTDIFAEDCHCAIRLLSVTSPIKNITIKNITCGCRSNAVNMDGARYCQTPLFKENEFPQGCGAIENVKIDGFTFWSTDAEKSTPLITAETRCKGFEISNMTRKSENENGRHSPFLQAKNLVGTTVIYTDENGVHIKQLNNKTDLLLADTQITSLKIDTI